MFGLTAEEMEEDEDWSEDVEKQQHFGKIGDFCSEMNNEPNDG